MKAEEKLIRFFFWFCFTSNSEALVVLHTQFTLLYLRGGLCWDWGLACRRSTAIFTSENKSIQTLNIIVTFKSAYAFTQNEVAASTLPPSKWNWAPKSKLGNPNRTSIQNAANWVAKCVKLSLGWTWNEGILFSPSKSTKHNCSLAVRNSKNHRCQTLVTHLNSFSRNFKRVAKERGLRDSDFSRF